MNPLRGILLKILSVTIFVLMATCIKAVADHVPPGETVFFRSLFAVPVILVWLIWQHDLAHGLETKNLMGHFWRGLVGTTAMGLGFTALGLLPLPEVTALGYAAPVLTVIFAAMFLGEPVRIFRLSAVVLGLAGVVVILSPRLTVLSIESADKMEAVGALLMLMGAVFMALAQVFLRRLVRTESTATIVFYVSITATVLSLFTIPFGWVVPTWQEAGLLIAAGLLGGVGQILLTSSYRFADTSVIAPFEYTSILLAVIIGYTVFGEVPTMTVIAGVFLVICAGLLIIWREHKLGLERAKQRKVMTPQG
ncbi:MAG: DMT family transporter [Hyphomicrobiales bacterium]|nr:DMT family transporter [Hyphomicrobiales bacterium]